MVIDDDKVLKTIDEDLVKIKQRYESLITSGKLERELARLSKLQKRALTTNGPHPHHSTGPGLMVGYRGYNQA